MFFISFDVALTIGLGDVLRFCFLRIFMAFSERECRMEFGFGTCEIELDWRIDKKVKMG
jgi:hypothetical protein